MGGMGRGRDADRVADDCGGRSCERERRRGRVGRWERMRRAVKERGKGHSAEVMGWMFWTVGANAGWSGGWRGEGGVKVGCGGVWIFRDRGEGDFNKRKRRDVRLWGRAEFWEMTADRRGNRQ